MSKLLLDSEPLIILPDLAVKIGLNESIILQQIHYWLEINRKAKINNYDEHVWTFNTIEKWQEQFPFWSERTIKRILKSLKEQDLIITGNYNKKAYDRTLWYTINYKKVEQLENEEPSNADEISSGQNGTMDSDNVAQSTSGQNGTMDSDNMERPIPETSSETSPKTTTEINLEEEETIIKKYKNAKGKVLTKSEKDKLKQLLNTYSKDLILKAIDEMVLRAEKINLKYIQSTLEDWNSKGLLNLDQVKEYLAKFEVKKAKVKDNREKAMDRASEGYVPSKKASTFTDYNQREYSTEQLAEIERKLRGIDG
ncbi:DnaD domain protein [Clostridium sp. MSJ-11]|uniref:DnaD domain protein n=1 Tax=Clostridium mobile TaxID=2841512 RepID=A0ABS6ENU5_9CLOT|nr:DnaD domain protein [Clostridium mobile]MBU5486442.1 DnaD domain protein [Clostridium mobile]